LISIRQDKTSLSSCEAEIRATNETSKLTVALLNLAGDFSRTGVTISDNSQPTTVYNNNEPAVKWAGNLTMKQIRHMDMRDNYVREWVQDNSLDVRHVAGKCNVSDICTMEMKDGANYRRLRDSFMCRASTFLRSTLAAVFRRQTV